MKNIFRIFTILALTLFIGINSASSDDKRNRVPMIGDLAPAFKANSTKGKINFPDDYWNKWVVLFCHPADFTPVCTSELMCFAELSTEFEDINCKLLGLSVDGINSHIQWIKEIENIEFNGMKNVKIDYPLIADTYMKVSKKYGMIHPNANSSKTVRGVFIIDDKQRIQATMMYPMVSGRNIKEILRLVKALQTVDEKDVATPEGWHPGDNVFLKPIPNKEGSVDRYKDKGSGYECQTWFMCYKPGD